MNIRDERGVKPTLPQFIFDLQQVFRFLFTWSCDPDQLSASFDATDRLFHCCDGIHRIGGGHCLDPDRAAISNYKITYTYLFG